MAPHVRPDRSIIPWSPGGVRLAWSYIYKTPPITTNMVYTPALPGPSNLCSQTLTSCPHPVSDYLPDPISITEPASTLLDQYRLNVFMYSTCFISFVNAYGSQKEAIPQFTCIDNGIAYVYNTEWVVIALNTLFAIHHSKGYIFFLTSQHNI